MTWCEWPGVLIGNEAITNYGCRMFGGLALTLQLVAVSIVLGALLGIGLALTRLFGGTIAAGAANAFMTFFRGTPLICQLFLVYYGAGQFRTSLEAVNLWWFFREPFYCALFSFTINTAAYQAEVFRGAIQSIGRGQFEGALALGLHRWATLRHVILPQAMIVALRPLGNELIVMIKSSSVASLVTLFDLMGATRLAFSRSFDLSIYLYAAILYLAMVEIIRRLWDLMEKRLTRHVVMQ
jgi:polar amino acid transport system permease protein